MGVGRGREDVTSKSNLPWPQNQALTFPRDQTHPQTGHGTNALLADAFEALVPGRFALPPLPYPLSLTHSLTHTLSSCACPPFPLSVRLSQPAQ